MVQTWQTDIAETINATHFEGSPAEALSELRAGRTAEVVIPAGRLLVPGTTDKQLKLPTSAAEVAKARGISVLMPLKSETSTDFQIGEAVLFCEDGEMWVVVEEAVVDGDQAFARYAAGSFAVLGRFRKSADTATAAAVPGARFSMTQATIGGLCKIKFDLPATG